MTASEMQPLSQTHPRFVQEYASCVASPWVMPFQRRTLGRRGIVPKTPPHLQVLIEAPANEGAKGPLPTHIPHHNPAVP